MNWHVNARCLAIAAAFVCAIFTCATFTGPADAANLIARPDPLVQAPTNVQYYPPQGYYPPPPAYYAPPPRYYAPPPQAYYPPPRDLNRAYDPTIDGPLGQPTQRGRPPVPYSAMCYAGPYTCQLPNAGPVGAGCSCPGLGAPSYGSIR